MEASNVLFKLMQKAHELGIGQCYDRLWERNAGDCRHYPNIPEYPISVCIVGLQSWGQEQGVITSDEANILARHLPFDRIELNNKAKWTFPDFYSYLKDKEEKNAKKTIKSIQEYPKSQDQRSGEEAVYLPGKSHYPRRETFQSAS